MKRELAERLYDCLMELGEEAELHEDYSGRCMFGGETYAVSVGSMSALLKALYKLGEDFPEDYEQDIGNLKMDSFGLGKIVY